MITVEFLQKITLIDPSTRKEVINQLKQILKQQLSLSDHKKIWKALYYGIILFYKPCGVQISITISNCFPKIFPNQQEYFKAILEFTFNSHKPWFTFLCMNGRKQTIGRVNKFMLLFREIIEEMLKLVRHHNFKVLHQSNEILAAIMQVSEHQAVQGLTLHFIQIYVSCLQKHLNDQDLTLALQPFLDLISTSNNKSLRTKIYQNIFEKIKDKKESENAFAQFDLQVYGGTIFKLAQEVHLQPPNRKMLYDLAQLYHFIEDPQENEKNEEPVEVIKKKKKNKKAKVVVTEEPQEAQEAEEVEQIVETHHAKVTTNGVNKSHKVEQKQEQKKKSILQQQDIETAAEEDDEIIEGLDYSEVRQSPEKMKLLKSIIESVPPYLFMSPAEKRKYFKQINSKFLEIITKENGRKCSHERSVKFNLQRNQIKEFDLRENVLKISQ